MEGYLQKQDKQLSKHSAVVASLDKNLQIPNAETLQNNLASGWSVTGEDVGPFTATSPNGNVFTVDKNGTITGPNGETQTPEGDDEANTPTGEIPDLFRKYILGQDETGRLVTEIANLETGVFIDEAETIPDASTSVSYLIGVTASEGTTEMYGYIMYKEIAYKIIVDTTNYYTKSLEIEYKPQGNEGKDLGEVTGEAKYNGWTILYDDLNGTVEAVSPTAIGNLKLGCYDETAQTPGDIDENGIPNEDIDKAIYSYNNAIDRINNYCKEQVDDSLATDENVRSVGAAVDPRPNLNGDNAYNGIPSEWETSKYNGKIKTSDTAGEEDYLRMMYFEKLNSKNIANIGERYFIASRYNSTDRREDGTDVVEFWIRSVIIESNNSFGGGKVLDIEENTTYPNQNSGIVAEKAVRPIIKVSGV